MKIGSAFIILAFAMVGCQGRSSEEKIRTLMDDQAAAWDAGDLHGFMMAYSDTVCFIGSKGRTCGREAVTANYMEAYPDRSSMGDLTFDIHEVLLGGAAHAWVTGNWRLERISDTLGGGFSLFWVNEHKGWRIVRDHTY
ncbi:MAG: nuclear transport factor 2 family protein [Flavobacteriales bacterium]|nr:nuclear transport factor 2 family protein [Flavobacteriales bacterium]